MILLAAMLHVPLKAQTYFLNGTAQAIGNDCYRLTTTTVNQNGTVWYADLIDLNEPFDLEFTMNFGVLDGNGADGMVFVLQTAGTDAIGNTGQGIGYSGFAPSFGVEFDTWQNGDLSDPFADHIAMLRDGNVLHTSPNNLAGPVDASAFSTNIEDGVDHIVRIIWDPVNTDVEVWFDCEMRLIHGVDLINTIFGGENEVWWGFTGATGGSWNDQTVCLQENILSVGPNVSICTGASTQLVAAGDPNAIYTWEPPTGLDNPNSQTPIASPDVTTTYTVSYTDLCGIERTDEVTVEVSDLEVEIPDVAIITCDNPEVNLVALSNFNNDLNYSWSTADGEIDAGQNQGQATVSAGGTYLVEVDFENLCFASASILVDENLETFIALAESEGNIDCNNPEIELTAFTDGENVQFEWNTADGSIISGEDSNTAVINTEGNYILTITNPENGCQSQDEIVVANNVIYPTVNAGLNDTLDCTTPVVNLNGAGTGIGNLNATWTTLDGNISSGANTFNPEVNLEGVYTLTVTDLSNGCASTDDVFVYFDSESLVDLSSLTIPNVFSPNNDGINEFFSPLLLDYPDFDITGIMQEFELSIYSRWGNLVYQSNGNRRFWDGRIENGELSSEGVYYYILRYTIECGESIDETVTGTLQLLM